MRVKFISETHRQQFEAGINHAIEKIELLKNEGFEVGTVIEIKLSTDTDGFNALIIWDYRRQ